MKRKINSVSLIVAFFIAVGACLRVYHFDSLSLWADELFSITLSSKEISTLFEGMQKETNPPLYQLLLFFWIKCFGNASASGRILSVIISILTIPVIYFLTIRINDKYVSLSTTIFFALSSGSIYFAQEVRSYSLLILLSSVSFLLWMKIISIKNSEQNTRKEFIIYLLISVLCSYTHYFGYFFVNLQWSYLVLFSVIKNKKKIKRSVAGIIILNALFIPELYKLFLMPPISSTGVAWVPKPNWEIYFQFYGYVFYTISFKKIPTFLIFIISLILPPLIHRKEYKERLREPDTLFLKIIPILYIIFSLLVATYLLSQFKPIVTSRNLLVLLLPIYLLVSLWYSFSPKLIGLKQNFLVIILSLLMVASFSKFYFKEFVKEPWREVTAFALEAAGQSGYIFSFSFPEFVDYYLVDVYKGNPIKKVKNEDYSVELLLKDARENKVGKIVFIETLWDAGDKASYKSIEEKIDFLRKESNTYSTKIFLGMKVHTFEIR